MESKRSSSGRKQWDIHNRSLSQLLSKEFPPVGCPESRVLLAKDLLNNSKANQSDFCLGVNWLIKSSNEGNTEATNMLKDCLRSGKGITDDNIFDVKSCIEMSLDEKVARRAAREMFACLSTAGEYITSHQLETKMLEIDSTSKPIEKKTVYSSPSTSTNGELNNYDSEEPDPHQINNWIDRIDRIEKLTEENLLEAAKHYSHGQLPLVNQALTLNNRNRYALEHIPFLHQSLLHPLRTFSMLYYKLLQNLARNSWNLQAAFKSEYQLFYLLIIYTLFSTESLLLSIPMITYYLTIIVMILSTCKMLQVKREFSDFRMWSGLFLTYSSGHINAQHIEFQYIKNNLKPYAQFFVALLLNLLIYPIISEIYLPQSELTILSLCMTFATLFGFMYKKRSRTLYDCWILLSFAVNVLVKYPYETDSVVTQGWRYLDLKMPTLISYVIGMSIEFCINFKLLLSVCILAIFAKLAYRDHWRGIYMFLIPHCVTLSWFQLAVISSQGATMYGLIRGILALVGVVMFIPLAGLTTIVLPAAALSKGIIANDYFYTICLFLVFVALGIGINFLIVKLKLKSNVASQFQVILAAIGVYFLVRCVLQENNSFAVEKSENIALSYDQFAKFCHSDSFTHANDANLQLHCSRMKGVHIAWQGYIHNVKITSTTNNIERFVNILPNFLKSFLSCYFGEQEFTEELSRIQRECHLGRFDKHILAIGVKMQAGLFGTKRAEVILQTNVEVLQKFGLKLRQNDAVWFKGVLRYADSERIVIELQEIACTTCADVSLTLATLIEHYSEFDSAMLLDYVVSLLRTVINLLVLPHSLFK